MLSLGHLGERVQEAVGDGSRFGLEVAYSFFDGPELRGTGGAIRRALPLLGPAFFVLYGDSYLDEYSLDTVKMFRNDAVKAGFRLG